MTVETQTSEVNLSTNGSATVFSFSPIVIFATTDIIVTTTLTSTGVETTRTEGTGADNYSVTVASFPGTGSITFPATGSATATGTSINIKRVLTLEQLVDLENQGGYLPDTLEEALDKSVMIDLAQQEDIDRSFRAAIGETTLTSLLLPNSSTVTSGSAANLGLSSDHTKLEFSVSAGTLPDPVTVARGGTGATTTAAALTALLYGTKGGDIASASPIVIDTDGDYFDVTGTTNFSTMTVSSGRRFWLQFDGILTMTHNSTTLDLPGEANITTAAGDVGEFFSTGTDTVQCSSYVRANAIPAALNLAQIYTAIQRFTKGGDIASASPLVLDTDGNYFDVTGTTGFSQITCTAGDTFMLQFDGALTMTDGANLDLGGVNITTATGDRGWFYATATNTAQLISWIDEGTGGVPTVITREFFVMLAANGDTFPYLSNVGDFPTLAINDTGLFQFVFFIPTDFTSLTDAVVVLIPDATETLNWSVTTDFGASGEASTANSDSETSSTSATANQILEADVSATLTGLAAGDYVGMIWNSDTTNTVPIGLRIRYS